MYGAFYLPPIPYTHSTLQSLYHILPPEIPLQVPSVQDIKTKTFLQTPQQPYIIPPPQALIIMKMESKFKTRQIPICKATMRDLTIVLPRAPILIV